MMQLSAWLLGALPANDVLNSKALALNARLFIALRNTPDGEAQIARLASLPMPDELSANDRAEFAAVQAIARRFAHG